MQAFRACTRASGTLDGGRWILLFRVLRLYALNVRVSRALKKCGQKMLCEKTTVDMDGGTNIEVKQNPLVVQKRQILAQMRGYIAEFGLSPSSRGGFPFLAPVTTVTTKNSSTDLRPNRRQRTRESSSRGCSTRRGDGRDSVPPAALAVERHREAAVRDIEREGQASVSDLLIARSEEKREDGARGRNRAEAAVRRRGDGRGDLLRGCRSPAGVDCFQLSRRRLVRNHPILSKRARSSTRQKRIVFPKTGSVYVALSSRLATKHGFNASGIIFDELHAQPNRELWDVLTAWIRGRHGSSRSYSPSRPPGTTGTRSATRQKTYAEKVRDGVIEDPTFLPVIYGFEGRRELVRTRGSGRLRIRRLERSSTLRRSGTLYKKAKENARAGELLPPAAPEPSGTTSDVKYNSTWATGTGARRSSRTTTCAGCRCYAHMRPVHHPRTCPRWRLYSSCRNRSTGRSCTSGYVRQHRRPRPQGPRAVRRVDARRADRGDARERDRITRRSCGGSTAGEGLRHPGARITTVGRDETRAGHQELRLPGGPVRRDPAGEQDTLAADEGASQRLSGR